MILRDIKGQIEREIESAIRISRDIKGQMEREIESAIR